MIYLIKSLNKSILGKAKFKHWVFLDTQKNLIYSYEYDIVGNKFKNEKVKIYTYEEYDKIVDSEVTYAKLDTYFDLDKYLNYSSEKATCMDFCLDIMEKESVAIEIINSAYDEYIEAKNKIKKYGDKINGFLEKMFIIIISSGLSFVFGMVYMIYILSKERDLIFKGF